MTGAHTYLFLYALSGGHFSNNHVPRLLGSESLFIPPRHRCPAAATWRVCEGLGSCSVEASTAFWAKNPGSSGWRPAPSNSAHEKPGPGPGHITLSGIPDRWARSGPRAASAPAALALLLSCAKPTVPATGGVCPDSRSCLWNSRFVKPLTVGQGLLLPPGVSPPCFLKCYPGTLNPCFVRRELTRTAPAP